MVIKIPVVIGSNPVSACILPSTSQAAISIVPSAPVAPDEPDKPDEPHEPSLQPTFIKTNSHAIHVPSRPSAPYPDEGMNRIIHFLR